MNVPLGLLDPGSPQAHAQAPSLSGEEARTGTQRRIGPPRLTQAQTQRILSLCFPLATVYTVGSCSVPGMWGPQGAQVDVES